MELYFKSPKTEKECCSQKEAERAFGTKVARKLMLRLEDLRAVECMNDLYKLPQLHCHILNPAKLNKFAITEKYRIVFRPAQNPLPLKQDGGIDQQKIFE